MSKKLFTLMYLCLAATIIFSTVGCEDDSDGGSTNPCDDVTCDAGETCINGDCVENSAVVKAGILPGSETWTADNIYLLASKVVVPDGATLTIEPGTIIKGKQGVGSLATALIVARGGQIKAVGTADAPIIFTSELDNIKVGETSGTNLDATDNSKWGGVIVLGRAPISAADGDTESQIEGIPGDEPYGAYGGNNPADNSGMLSYVSIRHGGAEIGAGNEINGLTLGGVGTGTMIDHVEVLGNLDDGIECFGGTVNIDHAAIIYQGDDALDLDQNYSGTINNFVVVMGGGDGDEALELDGPEGSTYVDGLFTLSNGTVSSAGQGSAGDLKSKCQGTLNNMSFTGFTGNLLKIRESFDGDNGCADKTDALDYILDQSRLVVSNCQFVGSFADADMANAYNGDDDVCPNSLEDARQTALDANISGAGNSVVGSASVGADLSEFAWTWAGQNGLLPS